MLTRIAGGRVIDPANRRDGIGDVWIRDDRIVEPPPDGRADVTHDATGKIVHGRSDRHPLAYRRRQREHRAPAAAGAHAQPDRTRPPRLGLSTFETGCLYATMGFTTVVEPAIAPTYALHAHLELADIPIIDKATLAVLGNDDFLLGLLHARESASRDPRLRRLDPRHLAVARRQGDQCRRAAAFKANVRAFSLDDVVPYYGVIFADHRQGAAARRARARHPASAACPLQQSRALRAMPRPRSPPSRRRKACRCTSPTCSSMAMARRADAAFPRRPPGSPRR